MTENVVHGMSSGLDAWLLKASAHVEIEALPLVEVGYTVFSINHRATPRFPYPAAGVGVQRTVVKVQQR